jgi:hypothetical protein
MSCEVAQPRVAVQSAEAVSEAIEYHLDSDGTRKLHARRQPVAFQAFKSGLSLPRPEARGVKL